MLQTEPDDFALFIDLFPAFITKNIFTSAVMHGLFKMCFKLKHNAFAENYRKSKFLLLCNFLNILMSYAWFESGHLLADETAQVRNVIVQLPQLPDVKKKKINNASKLTASKNDTTVLFCLVLVFNIFRARPDIDDHDLYKKMVSEFRKKITI
jgi:hypothetical protein